MVRLQDPNLIGAAGQPNAGAALPLDLYALTNRLRTTTTLYSRGSIACSSWGDTGWLLACLRLRTTTGGGAPAPGGAQEGRQDGAELRYQIEREDRVLVCVYQVRCSLEIEIGCTRKLSSITNQINHPCDPQAEEDAGLTRVRAGAGARAWLT